MRNTNNKIRVSKVYKRYILSFLIVLLLPISSFAFVFLQNYREIYREKVLKQAQISLEASVMELERTVEGLESFVAYNLMADDIPDTAFLKDYRAERIANIISAEIIAQPILDGISYYNELTPNTIYVVNGTYQLKYYFSHYIKMESEEAFLAELKSPVKNRWAVWQKYTATKEDVAPSLLYALCCYKGASAIREAAYKIIELEKLKDKDGIACNCGLISGGTAENTVPGRCVFTADIRYMNHKQMNEVELLVEDIASRSFIEGTSCRVTLKSRRQPMERTEKNEALLETINRIYSEVGLPLLNGGHSNGGSDAADMTCFGLPCLDSFGTEGGRIHRREEYAYRKSLKESAKRLAAVAYCI